MASLGTVARDKSGVGADQWPILAVVGETASGKSALATRLAKVIGGEIICADSRTVYREFDVGTAKPSILDRQEVPHHLVDFVSPSAKYSVALFKRDADQAIVNIRRRGKIPILVGGSGLYIDSVLFDYQFRQAPDQEERQRLASMELGQLVDLANRQNIDLTGIDLANRHRVLRQIESNGSRPDRGKARAFLAIGLNLSRQELKQRITKRAHEMMENGLAKETKVLAAKYGWGNYLLSSSAYWAIKDYLDGQQTEQQAIENIIKSDLDLAKKQRTWFRRNRDINWFINSDQAVDFVTSFYDKY